MARESFCLTWNFFHQHASGFLEIESSEKNFADVTLVSDELTQFKVHKFVLSACSPIFKNLLLENEHSHPMIFLNGVKEEEIKTILQLLYFGETMFSIKRLDMLWKVVEEFQLTDIKSKMSDILKSYKSRTQKISTKQRSKLDRPNTKNIKNEQNISTQFNKNINDLGCDQCDYIAKHRAHLKRHKESIHEGIIYECEHCSYTNRRKDHLRTHQKKHSL